MKTKKSLVLPCTMVALLLGLAACNDDSNSNPGTPRPPGGSEEQNSCRIVVDPSSIRAATVSGVRMQDACGLSKEEFLKATQKYD